MAQYHKIKSIFKRDDNGKFIDEFSIPEFDYLKNNEWTFTEKVDGMNIRIIWDNHTIQFGGKTDKAQLPAHLVNVLNTKFMNTRVLEMFEEKFGDTNVTLYGEGYGHKIQSGGKYLPNNEVDFVLFDILIGGWWLKREDVEGIANNLYITIVPIVGKGRLEQAIQMMRSDNGFTSIWGEFLAEGLVLRPKVELKDRAGRRIITKVKYRDFHKEVGNKTGLFLRNNTTY